MSYITVFVDGELHIRRDDYWGNRAIVDRIAVGEMFEEPYIAPESGVFLNDAIAIEDSAALFFDVKRIITVWCSACRFHSIPSISYTRAVNNKFKLENYEIDGKNASLTLKPFGKEIKKQVLANGLMTFTESG